ncbi:V-type ATP synthase subunit D [uncultured archaeon]|nr:V-type ATP synthase subunit D [uncultured archaeon]
MEFEVKPTRLELLNTKARLALAVKGHEILKRKRDALVLELFKLLKEGGECRKELNQATKKAYELYFKCIAIHGSTFISTCAMDSKERIHLTSKVKNVMGVKLIELTATFSKLSLEDYPLNNSSALLDETVEEFENILKLAIKSASIESNAKKLLEEIKKTNRRVNALENLLQPALKSNIKYIVNYLNLLENDRFFTLKLLKKRLQAKN